MPETLKHRTFHGRVRAHIHEVKEILKIQSRRGKAPMDGKRIPSNVLAHFDRKTDEEIDEGARRIIATVGASNAEMIGRVEWSAGQWWHEALRSHDTAASPPIDDMDAWRRHTTISSFRLERTASTLLVRAALGMQGSRQECEEAVRQCDWTGLAAGLTRAKTGSDYDVESLQWSNDLTDMVADTLRIRMTPPATYVSCLPGRLLEELVDAPFVKGSGVRILAATQMQEMLYVETDAHDEHNTVSYIHDPEGRLKG